MKTSRGTSSKVRTVLSAALLASGTLMFLGCKGNTTSAALPERFIPEPQSVTVFSAASDPRTADPLSNPSWQNAQWWNLTAPANTTRTTQPTRAALLFDADNLYVAFVCTRQPSTRVLDDVVSIYLDTTSAANGTELVKIAVSSRGLASSTWIRTSTPVLKRDDGSPDLAHPISAIPGLIIPGLLSHVVNASQTDGGVPVWTAVVAIPLQSLPLPLQTMPTPGSHWKFNLLRTVTGGGEQLQADLSPVYVGAQEFAPYRLAEMSLKTSPQ